MIDPLLMPLASQALVIGRRARYAPEDLFIYFGGLKFESTTGFFDTELFYLIK